MYVISIPVFQWLVLVKVTLGKLNANCNLIATLTQVLIKKNVYYNSVINKNTALVGW